MQIRSIRWPEDRDSIIEHIHIVHGSSDGNLLGNWYGTMPGFSPDDCFVIEDEGKIVAHTMLIPRYIQVGQSVLQASEIGVVGTQETYRRQGYASALMDRAITRMAERGDAISILFGIPNFYERWGYEYSIGMYLTSYESSLTTEQALRGGKWDMTNSHHRRTASQLGVSGKHITVRPFDSGDLPAVMMLYQESSAKGHSIISRDEQLWLWQLDYMESIGRADHESFLVAEYEGQMLGYLRLVPHQPVNWFYADATEFSIIEAAGDDADATETLLAVAAGYARDSGVDRIGLYVHPQSQLMAHVMAHGAIQRSFTGAGFVRMNDLSLALNSLTPTLENRLADSAYAGSQIRLRVVTELQQTEILIGVPQAPEEVVTLEALTNDITRLLLGWFGLKHLPIEGYQEQHADLLNLLFPQGDPRVGFPDLI
jgi:predicted acetyltransferase